MHENVTFLDGFLEKICPEDCSGYGNCSNAGLCECEEGRAGDDCAQVNSLCSCPH